jgi:hypothetical protein
MMKQKKALLWGALFGLIAPFVGLVVGLQVSPTIANIVMFPIIALAAVLKSPFGMWSTELKIGGLVLSIVVWALLFAAVSRLLRRR